MAGAPGREQALPLLATANNHGDLAVKLSSLKQAKDILLSVEPSHAVDLFPFLVELQYSPEALVRKYLLEVIDEIGAKTREHLSILLPVLLTFLKDNNPGIAKQSIITGSKFFYVVVEELAFQFQRRGIVERWLEELWTWMIKFRNALLNILFEGDSASPKLMALKFLEMYILHFTLDSNDLGARNTEVMIRHGRMFNISWIMDGHPILDRPSLASDAIRYLGILLDMLPTASNYPGSLTIAAISSLAAIARKRPVYYKSVLTALLEFKPNVEMTKARHIVSIQYALRTAFLGFLRCTHPIILESRDRLLKELRAMSAGDAADQAIRQVEKIMKNSGRVLRDPYLSKDDQLSNQLRISGDETKKRLASADNEGQNNSFSGSLKRPRYGPQDNTVFTDDGGRCDHTNGLSPKLPVLDEDLSPVEQMIALIGALIAEGERGVGSLEILISQTHPDLLADIVITNMKHLPKNPPPLTRYSNPPLDRPSDSFSDAQLVAPNGLTTYLQTADFPAQVSPSSSNMTSIMLPDMPISSNISTDPKRDPRRDPRRLDPRRMVVPVDVPLTSVAENNAHPVQYPAVKSDSISSSFPPVLPHLPFISDSASEFLLPTTQKISTASESNVLLEEELIPKDELQDFKDNEFTPGRETNIALHAPSSPVSKVEDTVNQASWDVAMLDEAYSPPSQETDQLSPDIKTEMLEAASTEMPVLPLFVELTKENQVRASRLALERIIKSYQSSQRTDFKQTQIALIARLFALIDVNDVLGELQKHVLSDYGQQKGHELVMHILYYLHSLMISDSASFTAAVYERFILGVAKSLIDDLPASDKSFSRLLGEVPSIPDSVMGLLDDICTKSNSGSDGRDGDRVTQGLGAIWSLILGRPPYRQACVDIALKCTIHPKDDVRAKATRLVSNKLYAISYLTQDIEKYGTDMFLSVMDHHFSTGSQSQAADFGKRIGEQCFYLLKLLKFDTFDAIHIGSQRKRPLCIIMRVEFTETSTSGSQVSEFGNSRNEDTKVIEEASMNDSSSLSPQAHTLMSLFFALCAKKPILLRLVFDNYGQAPKACKQAVHRHITVLLRSLESSCTELLHIISDPPHGSEDLLIQVLHVLSEGTTPPAYLVATIKQLYETRLKDAAVLIPILSAFSRDEVLPIFPRLVQLPLPKFQTALAHILQGSAHTGPALTPVEVLVAIHDISPDREGLPLKKITDACSACFEQRTVFTQQVLTKALNQMVDRTPLPLLFMRTVIQAIDAFPTMVNVVMEILSKLVNRQIWRMPKLWVGFLKCIFQTQPHSFHVLLQLPSPQLESALNKYPNLRDPLTAYVNQSSIKTSVQRSTLALLGLA